MAGMILPAAVILKNRPGRLSFRAQRGIRPRYGCLTSFGMTKGRYHAGVAAGTPAHAEAAVAVAPQAAPRLPLRLYPALGVRAYRQLWLGMMPATLSWQMNIVVTGYAAFQL